MQPEPDRMASELPCVWVTAGVLSYRPCDREFDCEACPLYQALRGGASAAAAAGTAIGVPAVAGADDPAARFLAQLGAGCTLHLDRAYSQEGLWLEAGADGDVRIGLDDYTLRLLQPVDGVVLPRAGVWFQRGAPCAWIDRGRLAIALHCPIACEVLEAHPRPSLAPAGDRGKEGGSWWFRVRPHEPLAASVGLLRNEALLSWYLGRVRAVHGQLDVVMHPADGRVAGPLLADGGLPATAIEPVLGRERFEALVATLFPVQI